MHGTYHAKVGNDITFTNGIKVSIIASTNADFDNAEIYEGGLQDAGQPGRVYNEASDDNNFVIQIVRKLDLFHIFF